MKFTGIKLGAAVRHFRWVLIALILLGGVYFYYFTVIVLNNETRIHERSFRGLSHVAENIQEEIKNTTIRNSKNFLDELRLPENKPDSAVIEKNYGLHFTNEKIADTTQKSPSPNVFFGLNNQQWNLKFHTTTKDSMVYATADEFLQPLMRNDLFPHYILLLNKKVIYEDIAGNYDIHFGDSLEKRNRLINGHLIEVKAGGESFKMFALPFQVKNEEWILGGLMPAAKYNTEKLRLDGNVIMALVALFFLCFLLFPFMKCFFMNKEEHLNSSDIVFSFFSFYLIAATLTIVCWNLYTYQALYRNGRETQLQETASQLSKSFETEIKIAAAQLKKADSSWVALNKITGSDIAFDIANIHGSAETEASVPADVKDSLKNIISYPFFENLIWIDSNGQQRIRWTSNKYIPKKINTAERPYFKNALQNNFWKDDSGNEFFIEVVKSWVADKKLAVVSMHSDTRLTVKDEKGKVVLKKLPVMAIASRFQSVVDPVLPDGFGFCIINEKGKVYFHSNTEYDLNEDFLMETGNNPVLSSALVSRMEEYFSAYYYGSKQRFYIKPVKNMPLFVVTFSNLNQASSHNTALLSSVSIFIFLQTLLIFIAALLIQIFRLKFSRAGLHKFELSWLKPDKANKQAYIHHIWIYTFLGILECVFTKQGLLIHSEQLQESLFTPAILISYSILAVGFSFYLIAVRQQGNASNKKQPAFPLFGISIFYLSILILFSVNLGFRKPELLFWFLLSQLLAFIPLYIINRVASSKKIKPSNFLRDTYNLQSVRSHWKYFYIFSFLLFVLLTGAIPAWKIYQLCYNHETILIEKQQQLLLAKSIWRNNDTTILAPVSNNGQYYQGIIANKPVRYIPNESDLLEANKKERALGFSWLYINMRPAFNSNSKNIESLTEAKSNDAVYQWSIKDNCIKLFANNSASAISRNNIDSLFICSAYHPLRLPYLNHFPGFGLKEKWSVWILLFYTGIIFFITLLYILMREFLRRVFFPPVIATLTNQEEYLKKIFAEATHKKHILIIGLPDSGKGQAIENIIGGNKIHKIDLTDANSITETLDDKFSLTITDPKTKTTETKTYVVLRNFEYCFHDETITKNKLLLLEKLLNFKNCSVILLSTTHALPFIEDYFEIIKKGPATGDQKEASIKKMEDAALAAERWMNVMNNFRVVFYKWKAEPVAERENYYSFLNSECNHSDFLYKLKPELQTFYRQQVDKQRLEIHNLNSVYNGLKNIDHDKLHEDLEIRISQMASFYYDSIWMSLSVPERKVLYDYTKDGLVNYSNPYEISMLVQKGVFLYENEQLKLMNQSFGNYILTRLNKDEINKIEADEKEKGSWHKMRNIIIAVIVVAGLFIFITQKETFNSLIAYLSAFSTGLFALFNIVNKIPGGAK